MNTNDMNETATVSTARRPFQLHQHPRDRLDQLRAVSVEHGCVALVIDQGDRQVFVDAVEPLPGDRILVVEESSLSGDTALCRVLTLESGFGFRSVAEGDFTAWSVVVEDQNEDKQDEALARVARELQLLRKEVLRQTRLDSTDPDVLEGLVRKVVAENQAAEYISIGEACKRFSLSRSTFDREKADPRSGLESMLTELRGRYKVPVAEFAAWYEQRRTP